jgi:hypothetical protein
VVQSGLPHELILPMVSILPLVLGKVICEVEFGLMLIVMVFNLHQSQVLYESKLKYENVLLVKIDELAHGIYSIDRRVLKQYLMSKLQMLTL